MFTASVLLIIRAARITLSRTLNIVEIMAKVECFFLDACSQAHLKKNMYVCS